MPSHQHKIMLAHLFGGNILPLSCNRRCHGSVSAVNCRRKKDKSAISVIH